MVQPTGTRYDFLHPEKPLIRFVVVIVRDDVYAVYEILGVEAEGTTYNLVSEAHRAFNLERRRPERPALSYQFKTVRSSAVGKAVQGWTAPRSPVARFGGRHFDSVEVVEI